MHTVKRETGAQLGHSFRANLVVSVNNAVGEEKVWRAGLGAVIWTHCQTGLLTYTHTHTHTHTDGGDKCHARETNQSLGDDRERVNEWTEGAHLMETE